jgi:hypothetical protein
MRRRSVLGVSFAVFIGVLVVTLVPLKQVRYTVQVNYVATETYLADVPSEGTEVYWVYEPYQATESYWESEPYEDRETYFVEKPFRYEILNEYQAEGTHQERQIVVLGDVVVRDEIIAVAYPIVILELRNTDNVTGQYTVRTTMTSIIKDVYSTHAGDTEVDYDSYLFDAFGETAARSVTVTLGPGESKSISLGFDEVDISADYYKWETAVTPEDKQIEMETPVTKYRLVEKTRTITLYRRVEEERSILATRQEQQERLVTLQRPETREKSVTLLDYLLHY